MKFRYTNLIFIFFFHFLIGFEALDRFWYGFSVFYEGFLHDLYMDFSENVRKCNTRRRQIRARSLFAKRKNTGTQWRDFHCRGKKSTVLNVNFELHFELKTTNSILLMFIYVKPTAACRRAPWPQQKVCCLQGLERACKVTYWEGEIGCKEWVSKRKREREREGEKKRERKRGRDR